MGCALRRKKLNRRVEKHLAEMALSERTIDYVQRRVQKRYPQEANTLKAEFRKQHGPEIEQEERKHRMKCLNRFQLRLYDELPTQMMFRIDDTVIIPVVSANFRARLNIHFMLRSDQGGVFESFIMHFETLWGRSTVCQYDGWSRGSSGANHEPQSHARPAAVD